MLIVVLILIPILALILILILLLLHPEDPPSSSAMFSSSTTELGRSTSMPAFVGVIIRPAVERCSLNGIRRKGEKSVCDMDLPFC